MSSTDIYIPVSSLAPSTASLQHLQAIANIDTITLKLDYTEASMNDILHFLQFKSNMEVVWRYSSKSESNQSETFSISERASVKIMKHFKNRSIYLEFYGLYQYHTATNKPLSALPQALHLIEELFSEFQHVAFHVSKIDINYDTLQPTDKLTSAIARALKIKNKTIYPTGVTYGTSKSRYKLVAYDKQAKDNLSAPIQRIELTVREKNRATVLINSINDLIRYIDIVTEDFTTVLEKGKTC